MTSILHYRIHYYWVNKTTVQKEQARNDEQMNDIMWILHPCNIKKLNNERVSTTVLDSHMILNTHPSYFNPLHSHFPFNSQDQIRSIYTPTQQTPYTLPFDSYHHLSFIIKHRRIHRFDDWKWRVFSSSSHSSHWERVDAWRNQEVRFLSKGNRWTANKDECGRFEW